MKFTEKKSLKEDTIVIKIIDEIKKSLIKEELLPGDKLLSEELMCKKFSVSRVSVREAMKILSALGVVTIKRGNGTYISQKVTTSTFNSLIFHLILQKKSSVELEELRVMLEIGIIEIAMKKITPEDIRKIDESIQNFEKEYSQEIIDVEKLSNCDLDFHLKIAKSTHNPLIIEIAKVIFQLYIASFSKILFKRTSVKESIKAHKMILEEIKSGDVEKTKEIIRMAAKKWHEMLLNSE